MILTLALFFAADVDLPALQAAVDRAPRDPSAWLALARGYDELGREADAIRAYDRAQPRPEAREALARFVAVDDPARAAKLYRSAADAYAADTAAADRCLRAAVRLTGDGDALAALLRRDPPTPETARELAELVFALPSAAEFAQPLRAWVTAFPRESGPLAAWAVAVDTPAAYEEVRQRLLAQPDPALARALVRAKAGRISPGGELWPLLAGDEQRRRAFLGALQHEPAATAELLRGLPGWRWRTGRGSDSRFVSIALQLAVQTDQLALLEDRLRTIRHGRSEADVTAALLIAMERQGRDTEVVAEARAGLADPGDTALFVFHRSLARSLMRLGREEEAIAAAAEAVRTSGEGSAVALRLMQIEVHDWFGRHADAHRLARELLERHSGPDDEREIRLRLASLADARGDHATAERQLARALELAPNDPLVHNNLGYHWAERNTRLDEAERLCRSAVARGREPVGDDPGGDDPSFRDSLGWVYYRQGRLIAAQIELERALALPGGRTDAVIWDHLGDVLDARGKTEQARAAWAEALARVGRSPARRQDPRPEQLRRKLAGTTKESPRGRT